MQEGITRARQCLIAAQDRMKAAANRHRGPERFVVDDNFWLNHGSPVVQIVSNRLSKLQQRWLAPFMLVGIDDRQTYSYWLKVPEESGMHPMINVTFLKRYRW
jgi:hypothetical protein